MKLEVVVDDPTKAKRFTRDLQTQLALLTSFCAEDAGGLSLPELLKLLGLIKKAQQITQYTLL